MGSLSQNGAFLMQKLNAYVVATAVPSPCGVFHCFTVEMNFGPVFQEYWTHMVLGDKAVCLCIHLTLAVTVGYRLEQGEYIHTMTTLIAACSSWITVGAVASKDAINCC